MQSLAKKITQRILSAIAILFGVATIIAGGRVLLGADAGYTVFRPLLIYNVVMGFAYVAAGIIAWRNVDAGKVAAGLILALNVVVLGIIGYLYSSGGAVAVDSVRAMTLRTGVWLALFIGFAWLGKKQSLNR